MFDKLILLAMFLLALSVFAAFYRLVRASSTSDRILALDSIGYNMIGLVALLSIMKDTQAFLSIMLLIGILAFLATVALCKYVERGEVIEYKRSE